MSSRGLNWQRWKKKKKPGSPTAPPSEECHETNQEAMTSATCSPGQPGDPRQSSNTATTSTTSSLEAASTSGSNSPTEKQTKDYSSSKRRRKSKFKETARQCGSHRILAKVPFPVGANMDPQKPVNQWLLPVTWTVKTVLGKLMLPWRQFVIASQRKAHILRGPTTGKKPPDILYFSHAINPLMTMGVFMCSSIKSVGWYMALGLLQFMLTILYNQGWIQRNIYCIPPPPPHFLQAMIDFVSVFIFVKKTINQSYSNQMTGKKSLQIFQGRLPNAPSEFCTSAFTTYLGFFFLSPPPPPILQILDPPLVFVHFNHVSNDL